MHIITTGKTYIDIDAYACMIAYAELLKLQGLPAAAISTGYFNESIPPSVRAWGGDLQTSYTPKDDDTFCPVDLSEPAFFDRIVDPERVTEVLDHHPGFEKYWQKKLGDAAIIEPVGAACTLVYEKWVAAGLADKMSQLSRRLLVCGLLDNTLNFHANITTDRDRSAYAELLKGADLPDDWPAQYFQECQTAILKDLPEALRNDTKHVKPRGLDRTLHITQVVLWDGQEFLQQYGDAAAAELETNGTDWFLTIIDIKAGRNIIIAPDPYVQAWLASCLDVTFDPANSLATTPRLWLRKEIFTRDIELYP